LNATRTQLDAAALRFHYRRGYDDAMAQTRHDSVLSSAVEAALILIAVACGWMLGRRHSKTCKVLSAIVFLALSLTIAGCCDCDKEPEPTTPFFGYP
jgi:hypothetical protein